MFFRSLVRALRVAGYDISRSADAAPGASDEVVLALAVSQTRILVTEDNDFGDLVVRFGLPTHGVVRVALKPLVKSAQGPRLIQALNDLGDKVQDALVTIEPNRTRLRPLLNRLSS